MAIRKLGLPNPICEIPNCVRLPVSGSAGPPPWAGVIPEGMAVLLYFGRLHPKKQLPALLRGWQTAKRIGSGRAKEWALAVIGWDEGNYRKGLEGLASQLALSDVFFAGPQYGRDKHNTLSGADAFILPSISEGLPLSVLEAWSYSLPVLMTRQCNLPEGFVAGAAIEISLEPNNMARWLSMLFEMGSTERNRIGVRGLGLVRERFNCRGVAEQMRDVYSWVLGGGPRPASVMT
ncbi:MAG TPA: glycosyltransferase [Thermoanaerobaculaceae bacterium]|nr:glycosyltransferase [Thermoanaerobaculaceae bacterium]